MGAAVKPARGRRSKTSMPSKRQGPTSPLDKAAGYEVVWPQVSELFSTAGRIIDCQYVYFIGEENDGPVKIGLA